jgi:hypothetical protein
MSEVNSAQAVHLAPAALCARLWVSHLFSVKKMELYMPIVIRQLVPAQVGAPRYAAAKELARQCADQYHLNVLPGPGGGIAGGSCWAAVAVTPGGGFPNLNPINPAGPVPAGGNVQPGPGGLGYGISFGNSQMAMVNGQVNLPGFNGGGHAERAAINAAGLGNLHAPGNQAILFVQLAPCPNCQAWLNALVLGPVTLNVYYRFAYPAGVQAMLNWNITTRVAKQADITPW